jgi:steroid delta-isomerase-like uncharacterized protein
VSGTAEGLARRYFDAIGRRDLDAAVACWRPGAIDRLVPVGELRAPEGLREYFGELFRAMPDLAYELLDAVTEGDRVAVRWRATGTFDGGPYQGIEPNGARIDIEGADLMRIEDGLIARNDSYWDDSAIARQLGLLPARGGGGERALLAVFNAKTAALRWLRGIG